MNLRNCLSLFPACQQSLDLLDGVDDCLLYTAKFAIQICRWHHERWDGSGYPDGRKGDDIPIAAQVVALADAYDGLVGKRDKHEALSQEEAVAALTAGKHGAFNPLLLECLRDVEDRLAEETEADAPPPPKKGILFDETVLG